MNINSEEELKYFERNIRSNYDRCDDCKMGKEKNYM